MGEEAVTISEESVEMVLDEEEVDQHKSFNKLESLLFLRVLLVEADNSSRIIISALLRKCGYKVAAVADGLKAWEILRGRPSDIDLVLTEVELPSIAGFSLLAMIMDDDICRQIPVIMMSSQDSINVVFNCMLKGAADFLVKPVRKNELRNLWQHVWRRNSLSNGGHSEQNVHRNQQKDEAIDENCSAKCSSDCMALPKEHKECSEKGSDAQSSCAKPAIGATSANVQNFWRPECKTNSLTDGLRASKYGEFVEVDNILVVHEDETKDKSIILVHEVLSCDEGYNSVGLNPELSGERIATCLESKNHLEDTFNHVETSGNNNELQPSREAMDLIGVFDNHLHMYNHHFQVPPTEREVHWYPNGGIDKFSSTLLLELSLRGPHSDHDIAQISEKKTLNHSNASAFSRYANRTIQAPLVASIDFCRGITAEVPPQSDIKLSNFPETMASFGDQSGEAKTAFESTQPGVISVPIPVRGTRANSLCPGYGAIFPTLLYTQPDLHSATSVGQQKSAVLVSSLEQFSHTYQQISCLQDQSTTNVPHQTIHGLETTLKLSEDPGHVFPATAQSATSSLCHSAVSHHNSNECRSECNVTTLGAGAGTMKDNGILLQEGTKEIDSHCLNQREVALNKFRLKRKDRCFEKKVRYQSRKRLAEQRPRVKGQFVRQMPL